MGRVLVSVVVPTYDAAAGLAASVESALAQRDDAVDVEVVVADGGSTDATIAIAEGYAASGHPVVVDQAPDRGVYDAMNRALARCRGDHVHYLGAGDTLRPGSLAALLAAIDPTDRREALLYGDVWLAAAGRFTHGPFDGPRFAARFGICHQAILWDRRTVERLGGYDLRYRTRADHVLTMRAFGDPAVRATYVPTVVANFEGGGLSDDRFDPGTAVDFPGVVRDAFGIEVPPHAWGDLVYPPADTAPSHDDVAVGLGAYVERGVLRITVDTEPLARAWLTCPDGWVEGTFGIVDGRPTITCWAGSWPAGSHDVRVDVVALDGRRGTGHVEIALDPVRLGAVATDLLQAPSGARLASAGRTSTVEAQVVVLGTTATPPPDALTIGALDGAALEDVVDAVRARTRLQVAVVLVDATAELGPNAVDELVTAASLAVPPYVVFGDEAGDEPVMRPGWSPARALCHDAVGPVVGVDLETLRRAVGAAPTPIRSVAELATRLVDTPIDARRIPRVLARRRTADATPLVEGSLAACVRLGRQGITTTPLPHVWPPAHDLRWRPQRAGHVSLVVLAPLGDPGSLERIVDLRASAEAGWPSVELVVADSSLHGLDVPADARLVRGPASGHLPRLAAVGAEAASGDTLVFVDEWTAPAPGGDDWLPTLLMHLDDDHIGAAGAAAVAPDGRTVRCGGLWIHPLLGPVSLLPPVLDDDDRSGAGVVPRPAAALHGVGFAIRAERWRELAGYATDLPGLLHVVDLGLRAHEAGRRLVLEPRSRLVHHGVVPQMWPWSDELATRLGAAGPVLHSSPDLHGHPAMDWRRPWRPMPDR